MAPILSALYCERLPPFSSENAPNGLSLAVQHHQGLIVRGVEIALAVGVECAEIGLFVAAGLDEGREIERGLKRLLAVRVEAEQAIAGLTLRRGCRRNSVAAALPSASAAVSLSAEASGAAYVYVCSSSQTPPSCAAQRAMTFVLEFSSLLAA